MNISQTHAWIYPFLENAYRQSGWANWSYPDTFCTCFTLDFTTFVYLPPVSLGLCLKLDVSLTLFSQLGPCLFVMVSL